MRHSLPVNPDFIARIVTGHHSAGAVEFNVFCAAENYEFTVGIKGSSSCAEVPHRNGQWCTAARACCISRTRVRRVCRKQRYGFDVVIVSRRDAIDSCVERIGYVPLSSTSLDCHRRGHAVDLGCREATRRIDLRSIARNTSGRIPVGASIDAPLSVLLPYASDQQPRNHYPQFLH